jgi:hypothetical protein
VPARPLKIAHHRAIVSIPRRRRLRHASTPRERAQNPGPRAPRSPIAQTPAAEAIARRHARAPTRSRRASNRSLLDRRAAGLAARRADVLVLLALGHDQQQPLAHRHRHAAPRTREQRSLQPLKSRPRTSRSHQSKIIPTLTPPRQRHRPPLPPSEVGPASRRSPGPSFSRVCFARRAKPVPSPSESISPAWSRDRTCPEPCRRGGGAQRSQVRVPAPRPRDRRYRAQK